MVRPVPNTSQVVSRIGAVAAGLLLAASQAAYPGSLDWVVFDPYCFTPLLSTVLSWLMPCWLDATVARRGTEGAPVVRPGLFGPAAVDLLATPFLEKRI